MECHLVPGSKTRLIAQKLTVSEKVYRNAYTFSDFEYHGRAGGPGLLFSVSGRARRDPAEWPHSASVPNMFELTILAASQNRSN